MLSLLRRFLSAQTAPNTTLARSSRPAFRPQVHALEDRLTPALSFAGQQTFSTGSTQTPWVVTVSDFDGDGRADLAVANYQTTTVSVLRNTTAGTTLTFAAPQLFTVGSWPSSLKVGDFNGDGRADLAVSHTLSNFVSVLRNTTTAGAAISFAAQQTFDLAAGSSSLEVADFNGDGRDDIAATVQSSNTVSVLRNSTQTPGANAAITFAAKSDFAVGSGPYGVSVGDFDGDGRADLATANYSANSVSVLRNTTATPGAAISFAAKSDFAVGSGTYWVAVGDLDGDGRADLATANQGSSTVSVLRNTTAAGAAISFAAKSDFAVAASPGSVAVGDFDGDGRADLATGHASGSNLSVLVNTTAGGANPSFAAAQTFAVGNAPYVTAVGDFDGDGRADLAAANYSASPRTISVLRNTSTGGTVTGPTLVGQFSNDGLWRYNRATNTWDRLTFTNSNALAVSAGGNAIASFGGNGVSYYRASTQAWTPISAVQAVAVAIDPLGNAYVSFAGYGTYLYRLATGTFTQLHATAADKLAASANGDLVGNFGSAGVSRYRPTTGWVSLATPNADALAIGENGDVAANFGAYGVYRFKFGTWALINSNPATALAVGANGSVAASFGSFGVAKYIPYVNGWQSLHAGTQAPSVAIDLYGNVFASLSGFGVYEFNPYVGWRQRTPSPGGLLGLGR